MGLKWKQIQEKQKYASWKAVDIRKALAEGRKPVPGPPVAEQDVPDGEDTTSGTEVPSFYQPGFAAFWVLSRITALSWGVSVGNIYLH